MTRLLIFVLVCVQTATIVGYMAWPRRRNEMLVAGTATYLLRFILTPSWHRGFEKGMWFGLGLATFAATVVMLVAERRRAARRESRQHDRVSR